MLMYRDLPDLRIAVPSEAVGKRRHEPQSHVLADGDLELCFGQGIFMAAASPFLAFPRMSSSRDV